MTTAATMPEKHTPKARDPYFSNAKLALIILVVIGHAWSPLRSESTSATAFYMTLYAFHMPAFILLCGYFSKSFTARPDQLRRMLTGILVPYAIFSLLYGIMRHWTGEQGGAGWSLLEPYYVTWFLAALFVWRLTSPFWRMVRQPILIAVLISIGAIMMNLPEVFAAGRILQFLPFFVVGMFLRREHFDALRRPLVRLAGLAVFAGVLSTAYLLGGELDNSWIYFNAGAEQMDLSATEALPIKLTLTLVAGLLTASFFAWIPDRQLPLTKLGDMTMYAFLLHGFLIKLANHTWGWYDYPLVNSPIGAILVTALAIGFTLVLCSAPVRWLTRPAVEPNLNWLLRPEPDERRARVDERAKQQTAA